MQTIHPGEALLAIGALLEERRAAIKTNARFSFALVSGESFVLDLNAQRIVSEGFDEDAEVLIVTNQQTLTDIVSGTLDLEQPAADHLFLWSGQKKDLQALASGLGGSASWLDLRVQERSS